MNKKSPSCAEKIQEDVIVCRYCDFELYKSREKSTVENSELSKRKSTARVILRYWLRWCGWILAVPLVLIVLLFLTNKILSHWYPSVLLRDIGRIVMVANNKSEVYAIYVVKPNGTGLTRLTNFFPVESDDALAVRINNLSWSPSAGAILFHYDDQLYKVDDDGDNLVQLSSDRTNSASWSPNGEKIIYVSDGIYVMNMDGFGKILLAEGDNPRWSPDSKKIVYIMNEQYQSHIIYVMNSDGSEQTRIYSPNCAGVIDSFTWSPDSKQLAFSCDGNIYLVNHDGSNFQQLTTDAKTYNYDLAWSPNSNKIAYTSGNWSTKFVSIMIMDVDTLHTVELVKGGLDLSNLTYSTGYADPVWSPDGNWILCEQLIDRGPQDGNKIPWLLNTTNHLLKYKINLPMDIFFDEAIWTP